MQLAIDALTFFFESNLAIDALTFFFESNLAIDALTIFFESNLVQKGPVIGRHGKTTKF